jgi:endonuclease/exonuclease/phosphatase family metal-dependent hydrolase
MPESAMAITWTAPPAGRDAEGLARWCQTVGPVLFRSSAASETRPIDRLAIVTWNVHVGSGRVDDLVHRLRTGEFTAGEPIDDYVLLLQEAYRRDRVPERIPRGFPAPSRIAARVGRGPDIDRLAGTGNLAVFYVPSMRNGIAAVDAEDRGNAIVSTLALRDPHVIELPLERQRRAAAVATVTGRTRAGVAWRLRLANVHLDTALALRHGGPFAARRRQTEALVDALGSDATIPTVLGGDFNTWRGPSEPALAVLRRAFPRTPAAPNLPTWSGLLGIRAQLDYVFVRGVAAAHVQRLPSRLGSDHYPLLTIIRF